MHENLAATFCGSPYYMAPEIWRGDKYDAKVRLPTCFKFMDVKITGNNLHQKNFAGRSMECWSHTIPASNRGVTISWGKQSPGLLLLFVQLDTVLVQSQ
jgi:serine/threonine protein kinase